MVDEGEAAVDAAPPAAATALDWDAADATEGPTDANLGADKTGGGASSVDSPPIAPPLVCGLSVLWGAQLPLPCGGYKNCGNPQAPPGGGGALRPRV